VIETILTVRRVWSSKRFQTVCRSETDFSIRSTIDSRFAVEGSLDRIARQCRQSGRPINQNFQGQSDVETSGSSLSQAVGLRIFEGIELSVILGLDTSTRRGSLALFDLETGRSFKNEKAETSNHGRALVPEIGQLVESAGLRFQDITGIAVGIGPGSYTGLRVGISVAKTMAEILAIPVVAIDSLILPVIASPGLSHGIWVSIADAQRGAVAESVYRCLPETGHWVRSSGPVVRAWNELERWKSSEIPVILTGPGLDLAARLGATGLTEAHVESRYPTSEGLTEWIRSRYSSERPIEIDRLEPEYLRPSAAEEKRQATTAG
jgi:tRNA threonylcarbamoyladenosine biosynthesis protein TsaB